MRPWSTSLASIERRHGLGVGGDHVAGIGIDGIGFAHLTQDRSPPRRRRFRPDRGRRKHQEPWSDSSLSARTASTRRFVRCRAGGGSLTGKGLALVALWQKLAEDEIDLRAPLLPHVSAHVVDDNGRHCSRAGHPRTRHDVPRVRSGSCRTCGRSSCRAGRQA